MLQRLAELEALSLPGDVKRLVSQLKYSIQEKSGTHTGGKMQ